MTKKKSARKPRKVPEAEQDGFTGRVVRDVRVEHFGLRGEEVTRVVLGDNIKDGWELIWYGDGSLGVRAAGSVIILPEVSNTVRVAYRRKL